MFERSRLPSSARIRANLIVTLGTQVLGIGTQFIQVPIFLAAWGDALYGDWLTLSALTTYLSLSDVGLQLYVANRLTGHAVRGEEDEFDRVWQSSLALYLVISGVLAVLIAVACAWGAQAGWLAMNALSAQRVAGILALLGLSTLVAVWSGLVGAMYRVTGANHMFTAVSLAVRSSMLLSTIVVLKLDVGPIGLAGTQLGIMLAALLWVIRDVRKDVGDRLLSLRHASAPLAVSMMAPSALFATLTIANALSVQGTVLVTAKMAGAVAVTTFSTSRTLANAIRQAVGLLSQVAWPEFTRLDASGNMQGLGLAHDITVKMACLVSVSLTAWQWFVGPELYEMWTAGRAVLDPTLLRLLLLHGLIQTPAWISSNVLTATNRHRSLSWLYVIQGVALVGTTPVAIWLGGLKGIGTAFLLVDVPLFCFFVPRWTQRLLSRSLGRYLVRTYGMLALMTVLAGFCAWCGSLLDVPVIGRIAIAGVMSFLPAAAVVYKWLAREERVTLLRIAGLRRRAASHDEPAGDSV